MWKQVTTIYYRLMVQSIISATWNSDWTQVWRTFESWAGALCCSSLCPLACQATFQIKGLKIPYIKKKGVKTLKWGTACESDQECFFHTPHRWSQGEKSVHATPKRLLHCHCKANENAGGSPLFLQLNSILCGTVLSQPDGSGGNGLVVRLIWLVGQTIQLDM